MRKTLFTVIFSLLANDCFAHNVSLYLEGRDHAIAVTLVNRSGKEVKLSRLFTQNPAFGLIQLRIVSQGRTHVLRSPPNENFPTKSDYISMRPAEFFGQMFDIADVRRWYGITSKCFTVSAKYRDVLAKENGAYAKTIMSKKIEICQ